MLSIILAAAAAAMMTLWIRPLKSEYAMLLTLAAMLLVFGAALTQLKGITAVFADLASAASLDAVYLKLLMKIMGLAWVSQLASDICQEAGCVSISRQIEIYSRFIILSISLPIVTELVQVLERLLT